MSQVRSYCNPFPPRFGADAQRARLTGELYTEDRSGRVIDALIRSLRKGDVVEVTETFLLAPVAGRPSRRRKVLGERLDAIKARGATVMEISTGHKTPRDCSRMILRAYELIANSGRGAPGKSKSGRPPKEYPPDAMQVIRHWWPPRRGMKVDDSVAKINALIAPRKVSKAWLYINIK